MSQPPFDDTEPTEEPTPEADAGPRKGRSVGSLFALAGVVVVVLGGIGATGLYLTRDPGGP